MFSHTRKRSTAIAIALVLQLPYYRINAQQPLIALDQATSRLICAVPFTTFTGGVVVVRGHLAGFTDSLNFIIDTGSEGNSLDSSTCSRLKIRPVPSDKTSHGIAGIRPIKFVRNMSFSLGATTLDSLDFHVNDLSIISSVFGDNIDGIIGLSFFSHFIINIDYDNNKLNLYSKGAIKYPRGGFILRPAFLRIPVQSAKLKEARDIDARFYFDTGAGLCLLLSSDFIADSSLLHTKKKYVLTEAEGLGGSKDMKLTTVRELRLGPYRFKDVPAYIFDDEYNVTSYPSLAGLIGNDLLRRFNIWLNFDHREFYLRPNTHYLDPFDYSYTGMGIFWIDGQIRVGGIMKGSPAEKAGFKINDIIIAINNDASGSLQTYKGFLQNIGERVRFIVKRSSGLKELTLKVQSFL
jgi:hypothetical protein